MSRARLGEILLQEGKIDQTQLKTALAYQRRWGHKLGQALIQLDFITELDLCQTLSKALRVPLIDISKIESSKITKEILHPIDLHTARTHRIVPLSIKEIRNKRRLVVGTSDPTNYQIFDDIQFKSGLPLLIMISPDSDIDWFIRKYYMNETEVLPINYVSGISVIDEDSQKDFFPDPISTIFNDENFTGITVIPKKKDDSDDNQ